MRNLKALQFRQDVEVQHHMGPKTRPFLRCHLRQVWDIINDILKLHAFFRPKTDMSVTGSNGWSLVLQKPLSATLLITWIR